jgi:hypothetical protein
MHKSQHRTRRNVRKQGNMTPSKVHNSSIVESKDTEIVEMTNNLKA